MLHLSRAYTHVINEALKRVDKFGRFYVNFLIIYAVFFCVIPTSHAMDVTLEWDPSPAADHYVVCWRTSSQNYDTTRSTEVFSNTTHSLTLSPDDTYYFVVTAVDDQNRESNHSREVCALGPGHPDFDDPFYIYDRGWAITEGDPLLNGLEFIYHHDDPTPTIGPSNGIPWALSEDFPDVSARSLPLNLQSGLPASTNFGTPVRIIIPCPGYADVGEFHVYYFDEAANLWLLANDGSNPDTVQPEAVDWLDSTSPRENLSGAIAIKVKHFSGAQVGANVPQSSISQSSGGGSGGCFISVLMDREFY